MTKQVLIAGGGIGGMAAALACARAGAQVRLFERAARFSEVGAGIQIGPNVTRVLHAWGLADRLASVAAFPSHLQVLHAGSGSTLGVLRLGDTALARYGAPYATIHRADLLDLLLQAVREHPSVELRLDAAAGVFTQSPESVGMRTPDGAAHAGDLLVGADGLWSAVRQWLLDDGMPRVTGHVAYRALVRQADLPAALRSQHITVWLGPDLHLVQYPVRCGEWLNVVGIVNSGVAVPPQDVDGADGWDLSADAATLRGVLAGSCAPLQDLVQAITHWRMWVLCDRAPMTGALQHGHGRVALLGDAAHPMRPYLAQGAGMAIEDAAELGRVLGGEHADVAAALRHYAGRRWERNRRVQARAIRNGQIFHARGLVRAGRDASLRLLGERLLDLPWLYRG